uniref:Uncharacterized protein n=1 Tax=Knipowitschia caucasica TaxID=637954 RepID=A0AAV2ITL6_KNICA
MTSESDWVRLVRGPQGQTGEMTSESDWVRLVRGPQGQTGEMTSESDWVRLVRGPQGQTGEMTSESDWVRLVRGPQGQTGEMTSESDWELQCSSLYQSRSQCESAVTLHSVSVYEAAQEHVCRAQPEPDDRARIWPDSKNLNQAEDT